MTTELKEDIIKEGIDTLYSHLGAIKTIKFLQLVFLSKGDSVKEIDTKTQKLSKENVLNLITYAKKQKPDLWKKFGLL